ETGGRPDKEKTDTEKTDTEKTDKEENRGEDSPVIEEPDRKAPEVSMDLFFFTDAYGRQITTVNTIKLHVCEEHFDPEWMPEVKTAVKDGWTFSGWGEKADGADGVITLKKDGEYEVSFQCRDQAGNPSERISSGRFLLDKTSPAITIEGVQNRGAYASPVTPLVYIEDPSFDLSQITCTLRGAKTGELDVGQLAEMVRTDQGVAISWDRFAGAADDVYTLSVQAQDQAGNTAEEEIVFAMDQNGSSYIISDATKKLMEDYYTAEPIELVLSEINTSAVVYEISLSKDGQPVLLEEGKDYSVEVRGGDGDWLIYVYRIFASNFEKEGVYHVDLTSWDQADNVNNSQMRGARIDFAVDHTPPVLLVENLEDGAWYKEKEHPFLIRTTDKTKLACLRVLVDGHIVLDKKDFANKESFTLKESNKEQVVQVLAVDKAGNQVASEEYKVLVQHNEKLVPKEIREKNVKEKKESGSSFGREQPEQENLLQKKGRTITFTVVVLLIVAGGIAASVWILYRRKNRKK
ncbi:MAG: Ig-like domain-containing protein, partial [Lachnospiraceae bacterium]|nr:Ig-like domain-containing protein [Lachnospiraceae bacterium]